MAAEHVADVEVGSALVQLQVPWIGRHDELGARTPRVIRHVVVRIRVRVVDVNARPSLKRPLQLESAAALYVELEQVQPTPARLNCGFGLKKLSGNPAAARPMPWVRRSSASARKPTLLFWMSGNALVGIVPP